MKKLFIITVAVFFATTAFASSKPGGLSVSLGAGYTNNGRGLRSIVEEKGIIAKNSPMGAASPLDPFIANSSLFTPSELISNFQNNYDNPTYTNGEPINDFESDTSLHSGNFSFGMKYVFLDFLFIQTGIQFEISMAESYQRIKFNDYSSSYTGNFGPSGGSSLEQYASYEYLAVPLIFGINIPLYIKNKYKGNAYIGGGAIFIDANYSFEVHAPEGYLGWNQAGQNFSGYDINLEYSEMIIGLNVVLGLDYEIFSNTFYFIEFDTIITPSVDATCEVNESNYNVNTVKTTVPMDFSGSVFRMGISYNVNSLIGSIFL